MRKYNFGVRVTGMNKEESNTDETVIKKTVAVNMKENKVEESMTINGKEPIDYFENIKKLLSENIIDSDTAAHMISNKLKETYIDCISKDYQIHIDIEKLDKVLFNSFEDMVQGVIEKSMNDKENYDVDLYRKTFANTIWNSTKLLKVDPGFDYIAIELTVFKLINDFGK